MKRTRSFFLRSPEIARSAIRSTSERSGAQGAPEPIVGEKGLSQKAAARSLLSGQDRHKRGRQCIQTRTGHGLVPAVTSVRCASCMWKAPSAVRGACWRRRVVSPSPTSLRGRTIKIACWPHRSRFETHFLPHQLGHIDGLSALSHPYAVCTADLGGSRLVPERLWLHGSLCERPERSMTRTDRTRAACAMRCAPERSIRP